MKTEWNVSIRIHFESIKLSRSLWESNAQFKGSEQFPWETKNLGLFVTCTVCLYLSCEIFHLPSLSEFYILCISRYESADELSEYRC